jgi:hypothetical protein
VNRISCRSVFATLALVVIAALASTGANAEPCCQGPNAESTIVWGMNPPSQTNFLQTVSNGAANYDTTSVQEGDAQTGSDTCYFNGSSVAQSTGVSGGTWTVGSPNGHNQWGFDTVGIKPAGLDYYRIEAPAHGHPLPCGFTVYQSMAMLCPGHGWEIYTPPVMGNILTITINTATVVNCRNDMSNAACQTINR